MFSKVSVAGALLLESHSWYLTQVLSRSSMKPFSWELQGVGGDSGEKVRVLYIGLAGKRMRVAPSQNATDTRETDKDR